MSEWTRCPSCGTRMRHSDPTCRNCGAALAAATTGADDTTSPAEALLETDKLAAELDRTLAPEIQLLRKLGEGGMSTVYLARDPALRRLVAIKVLSPDLTQDTVARARFTREAEIAAAVSHPNVVGIHKVGTLKKSGAPYIVMAYVDGPTLAEVLASGAHMSQERAKRIVGQVAAALAAAHERGLVHRDIKPANIVLDRESDRAVVLDFGVSAVIDRRALPGTESLTLQGVAVGTPIYMSPEQAGAKPLTDLTDVYSLGAVAFELVTGRPPFLRGGPEAYLAAHLQDRPPDVRALRPEIDPQFAELINRCLTKAPESRPSAQKIARALVPTAHQLVEWPPPGLAALRGLGWHLLLGLGATVALASTFFATLVLVPGAPAVDPAALDSPVGAFATAPAGGVGVPLWLVLLVGSLLGTALAAVVATALGIRLALVLRWARASGYPWPVLLDVAQDPRRDTSLLLNANGPFALIGSNTRQWLVNLRRIGAAALALTIAAATIGLVGWARGWLAGTAPTDRLLAASELARVLLPALVGTLVTALAAMPETFVRGRGRTARSLLQWRRSQPVVREDLVQGWLAPASEPAAPLKPGVLWTQAFLPTTFAALVGAALVAVLAATLWATVTASDWTRTAAPAAAALLDEGAAWRPWLRAIGRVRAAGQLSGARVTVGPRRAAAWQAADSAATGAALGASGGAAARWLTSPRQPWWVQLPEGPPASVRAMLRDDAVTEHLAAWRMVARARRAPPMWIATEPDDEEPTPPLDAPRRLTPEGTLVLARLNEAAGLMAFARGNRQEAIEHARENIAVGHWLLADPVNGHLAATVIQTGRAMLFDIGVLTGDRRTLMEAERLGEVLPARGQTQAGRLGAAFLMAAPREPVGLTLIGDRTLPPYVRWSVLAAVVDGFCGSAREVLFGVDPGRRETLALAGERAADIPSTEAWAQLIGRRLDEWIETSGGRAVSRRVQRRGFLRVAGWFGFRGFSNRVTFCASAGGLPTDAPW